MSFHVDSVATKGEAVTTTTELLTDIEEQANPEASIPRSSNRARLNAFVSQIAVPYRDEIRARVLSYCVADIPAEVLDKAMEFAIRPAADPRPKRRARDLWGNLVEHIDGDDDSHLLLSEKRSRP